LNIVQLPFFMFWRCFTQGSSLLVYLTCIASREVTQSAAQISKSKSLDALAILIGHSQRTPPAQWNFILSYHS